MSRLSVTKLFTLSLLGILILFVLLSTLVFYRILSYEVTLSDISEQDFPDVVFAGQLTSKANQLATAVEMLTNAGSNATINIAQEHIFSKIVEIKRIAKHQQGDGFLTHQLNVINDELQQFIKLNKQKIAVDEQFEFIRLMTYSLREQLLQRRSGNDRAVKDNDYLTLEQLPIAQFILILEQALSEKRIREVRRLFRELQVLYATLLRQQKAPPSGTIKQLFTTFSENEGLLALKIAQLRLTAQSISRANFLKKVIGDYASLVELQANDIEIGVLASATLEVQKARRQLPVILMLLLLALIIVGLTIAYIRQRIVKRLVKLNFLIKEGAPGSAQLKELEGNDEISDIAHTFNVFTKTIAAQKKALERLSMADGLTGIANRRAFDIRLTSGMKLAARSTMPLSLLLIDVDYFKSYNDNYGHIAGDNCLCLLARTIDDCLHRPGDFVARYGGEEFACVLPDTDDAGADDLAQSILGVISELQIPHGFEQAGSIVTISIGVATSSTGLADSATMLIERADKALYYAKRHGRNRFASFKDLPSPILKQNLG